MIESVEDGILVTFHLEAQGKTASTKTWIRRTGLLGIDNTLLLAIANEMAGNFKAALLPYCSADTTLVGVTATDMSPTDGTGHVISATDDVGTSGVGQLAPFAASFLVDLKAAERGRSYQNRMFLPFITENYVDRGAFAPSFLASWRDDIETFRSSSESTINDWRIAIIRRKDAPDGRSGVLHDCDSVFGPSRVAYQLRRSR